MDTAQTESWHELFARYQAGKQAEANYYRDVWTPLYREERKRLTAWPEQGSSEAAAHAEWSKESGWDAVQDQQEAMLNAWSALENDLMQMPAPDHVALLWKVEHLLADDGNGSTFPWAQSFVAQAVADAAALLGEA